MVAASGMVLLVGVSGTPAVADPESGPPSGLGPMVGFVEGSPGTVDVGWSGPLVVAGFSTSDDFVYRLRVTGPEGYDVRRRFELDEGESMREEVVLDPVTATGPYRARLRDERGPVETVSFRVVGEGGAEPLLTVVRAPKPVFLPRVRDGIDDVARLRYSVSRAAGVTGTVLDGDGRVVHSVDLGRPAPGIAQTWTWDGSVGGALAERGRYSMRLDASPDDVADAGAASTSRPVRVASYRVGVTRRVERAGTLTSSRSPGGCRLAGGEGRTLDVDCRGAGRGTTLRYWFASGAHAARWRVTGDGTASRTSRRLGRGTAVVVRVPAGARWRTDEVVVAWRTRVLR